MQCTLSPRQKLFLLPDLMYLDESKVIAEERVEFMKEFLSNYLFWVPHQMLEALNNARSEDPPTIVSSTGSRCTYLGSLGRRLTQYAREHGCCGPFSKMGSWFALPTLLSPHSSINVGLVLFGVLRVASYVAATPFGHNVRACARQVLFFVT